MCHSNLSFVSEKGSTLSHSFGQVCWYLDPLLNALALSPAYSVVEKQSRWPVLLRQLAWPGPLGLYQHSLLYILLPCRHCGCIFLPIAPLFEREFVLFVFWEGDAVPVVVTPGTGVDFVAMRVASYLWDLWLSPLASWKSSQSAPTFLGCFSAGSHGRFHDRGWNNLDLNNTVLFGKGIVTS